MAPPELAPVTSVVPKERTCEAAQEEATFGLSVSEEAAPCTPADEEATVSAGSHSTFSKVARFLRNIRGLSSLPADELEALLHEWRFELLPPPHGGWGNAALKGAGCIDGKLPLSDEIPSQRELHDLLVGGSLPGCHQCVAHVLYPDFVPWPFSLAGARASRGPSSSRGSAEAREARCPADANTRAGDCSGSAELGASGLQRQATRSTRGVSAGLSLTRLPTRDEPDACPEESAAEALVRGQKVKASVLRHRAQHRREEAFPLEEVVPVDDCGLKAARERRQHAERVIKVEYHNERKLLERIRSLEIMKRAELEQQEAVQRREAQRQARQEALRKDLQAGYSRKAEEERAKHERDAQKQKEEAVAEQRTRRYHEKQKEQLNQWYAESLDASRDAQAKSRQAELQAQKKAQELEKKQAQKKTVRQLETLQKVLRIQAAAEERPPLPPKQHDLPRPILELVGEPSERPASARSGSQSARGASSGWATQARAMSNMYGLSDKEQSRVQQQLSRGVRGSARVAVGPEH